MAFSLISCGFRVIDLFSPFFEIKKEEKEREREERDVCMYGQMDGEREGGIEVDQERENITKI